MQKIIDEIIDDLIQLDTEFQDMESDLRKLLSKLLAAKPNVKIDTAFKKKLQKELLAKAQELKSQPDLKPKKTKFFNPFNMQKLAYSFGGVVFTLLVLFAVQQFELVDFSRQSVMSKEATFDMMDDSATEEANFDGDVAMMMVDAPAFGKGGGGGMANTRSFDIKEEADMDMMIDPYYEYTVKKYVYNGIIDLPFGDVEILEHNKSSVAASNLIDPLLQFDFDLVDLSRFEDFELQNINLIEDREFGYGVAINFEDGTISIHQNYQRWPDPYRDCDSERCFEGLNLDEDDMLSDAKVLEIAEEFVTQYGINLDNYGEPKVSSRWRQEVLYAKEQSMIPYYPESISVVYPLQLEGKDVINQGGDSDGIYVNINQRHKKVDGVWGLQIQDYKTSFERSVQDRELFRKFLEQGGLYGWNPPDAKVEEIRLGDPTEVLMKYWNYEDGMGKEMVIPALSFPILDEHPDVYQEAVVIPLVAEILEKASADNSIGYPEPYFDEVRG